MSRRTSLIPFSAAVGALALLLSSGSAFGAPVTYTVKSGTTTTGTTNYTAATTGTSPHIKFNDTTSGTALSCASGGASGTVRLGTSLAGAALGKIAASTWTGCKGPLGLNMSVTQSGTWNINATGATTNNVTAGNISNVNATVAATSGGCSFKVAGTVKARVTTSSTKQQLQVLPTGSTLKITNVSGCFGLVNNNDSASFAGTYNVTAAKGKLVISNP